MRTIQTNKILILLVVFVLILSKSDSQIYPSNFLWNGCAYTYNGYKSADTIKCEKISYKLIFEDQFDSTALDLNKWQMAYPWSRSLYSTTTGTGWEMEYYDDANVSVSNGFLHLLTKVDPGYRAPEPQSPNIFFNYTSGMVMTKLDYSKGKFEIRCKIPAIEGLWPAFWLYGPCAQEIDVFEINNGSETSDASIDAGHVFMTYHKAYDCINGEAGHCNYSFTKNTAQDLSADFHIYSVEWDNYKILWSIDGAVIREVYRFWTISPPVPEGPMFGSAMPVKDPCRMSPNTLYTEFAPFPTEDLKMKVIINTAVSMDRAGNPGILPQEFLTDYVRIYEQVSTGVQINSVPLTQVNLFPNPTRGDFHIPQFNLGKPIEEITILNLMGESINFSQSSANGTITLNLLNQPNGIYIVKIICDGNTFFNKLIYY